MVNFPYRGNKFSNCIHNFPFLLRYFPVLLFSQIIPHIVFNATQCIHQTKTWICKCSLHSTKSCASQWTEAGERAIERERERPIWNKVAMMFGSVWVLVTGPFPKVAMYTKQCDKAAGSFKLCDIFHSTNNCGKPFLWMWYDIKNNCNALQRRADPPSSFVGCSVAILLSLLFSPPLSPLF